MTRTIFLRCPHISSRGALVNDFLYTHRETTGMASWYDGEGRLRPSAPLEVVFIRTSRKPYFLLECRYPTEEEMARRTGKAAAADGDDDGDDDGEGRGEGERATEGGVGVQERLSDEQLDSVASAIIALSGGGRDPLLYHNSPVTIGVAQGSTLVSSEREKQLARLKRKREEDREQQGGGGGGSHEEARGKRGRTEKTDAPVTATSFVPRSVRRR